MAKRIPKRSVCKVWTHVSENLDYLSCGSSRLDLVWLLTIRGQTLGFHRPVAIERDVSIVLKTVSTVSVATLGQVTPGD